MVMAGLFSHAYEQQLCIINTRPNATLPIMPDRRDRPTDDAGKYSLHTS